jgi:hypothetical protein
MDKRYRKNYQMSVVENLSAIKQHGASKFQEMQTQKYSCPKCDGVISVHNRKCFQCDHITKLVEKRID